MRCYHPVLLYADEHSLLSGVCKRAGRVCFRSNVIMTHTLTAFMELMDHGIVSWENLSSVFIKKVLDLPPLLVHSFPR